VITLHGFGGNRLEIYRGRIFISSIKAAFSKIIPIIYDIITEKL
jgi:hypothetical protein